jgi:hypothetical protein
MNEITQYLIDKKFTIVKNAELGGFDLIFRIHEIHYLVWYSNLNYFGIAVKNIDRKGEPGGGYKDFNVIIIPTHVETIEKADIIINLFNKTVRR